MAAKLDLRTSVLALRVLKKPLGVTGMAGILWRARKAERRGQPWDRLGPPESERERAARDDCGLVVLVYEALCQRVGRDKARAVVAELVREGIVIRLRAMVPAMDRAAYTRLDGGERRAFLVRIVDQFPSATIGELEAGPERFRYTISRCEFVVLMHKLGHPTLADLFCVGDGLYFERHAPAVKLHRTGTLAAGDACCEFVFRWRE